MSPDYSKYLQDIFHSIKMIDLHLTHINSFKDYKSNFTITDSVERRLAIIGEALWKASKLNEDISVPIKIKLLG